MVKGICLVSWIMVVLACIGIGYNLYQYKAKAPQLIFDSTAANTGWCSIEINGKEEVVFILNGEIITNPTPACLP